MSDTSFQEQSVTWEQIEKHQDNKFIYRGHKCASWELQSSLERTCDSLHGSLTSAPEMERVLVREFRRRFHHYSVNVPDGSERLRWLSLMQHHGAPTRLLDWTYSIFIAVHFALERTSSECAVWKINKSWLNDEGRKLFKELSRATVIFDECDEDVEEHFKNSVLEEKKDVAAVVQVNPFQLDERLTIQKGVFLYPCDVSKPFAVNLSAMPGYGDPSNVLKLKIADPGKDDRRSALKWLHAMNISRATLFPGLDGFAQSLKVYHPRM